MALRKEDFDDEDEHQEASTMKRSRITIDISPELRRRIKMAALQNDLSISEYVGDILEKNVPDEMNVDRARGASCSSRHTRRNRYGYVNGSYGKAKGSFLRTPQNAFGRCVKSVHNTWSN